MKILWFLLFFLLSPPTFSYPKCSLNDNCICYEGTNLEVQCPAEYSRNDERLVIHIGKEKNTTVINCYELKNVFRMDLLPNITLNKLTRLEVSFCPLVNFKKLTEHFSMTELKVLKFEHASDLINLTREGFFGFDLDRLQLNVINFTNIDEDVFSELPNLHSLELQRNKNLTLKPKMFDNFTKLTALYLADNGLEEIPEGIFKNLSSLKILHLWGNNLTVINDTTFSGLANLTSLELSSNKIKNISENAFKNLRSLSSVNLSGNNFETISVNTFKHNEKITLILMRYNLELQLPDYLFAEMKALETVDLQDCNLRFIPEHIFENSISLTTLYMQNNKLEKMPEGVFQGLVNLKEVHLENNLISEIDNQVFKDLINLEVINLSKNRIAVIDYNVFDNKKKLRVINLSFNNFSGNSNPINILEGAQNVEELDFSHNLITDVEKVISSYSMVHLEKLDLSYNRITEIYLKSLQGLSQLNVKLDYNNITKLNFISIDEISGPGKSTISLNHNPFECNCNAYEVYQFLHEEAHKNSSKMFEILSDTLVCGNPSELEGLTLAEVEPYELMCEVEEEKSCPYTCSCKWRPHNKSMVIDCSYRNLSEFPVIDHKIVTLFGAIQIEMHLEGNALETGLSNKLQGYDNVTLLDLSFNKLKKIEWLPPKLKELFLDNNEFLSLSSNVLNVLSQANFTYLTLHNNSWICDCSSVNLTNFLRQYSHRVYNVNTLNCLNTTNKFLINLSESDLCYSPLIFYITIPILFFLLFFTSILVLFYRFEEEIKVWLFAHDLCLWWVTEKELDKNKLYDAFISYSHKDEDFVFGRLVSVLENGPNPYKLCLHHRDWFPGEFISTHITNSVLNSRRTLVVLSQNFLDSMWAKMEFRTAHCQALTEGRARVIIVLYGDIDMEKVDDELKAYMKTNTYLKWEDPHFWDKLKYALPHNKEKILKNARKMANVMDCIEDKFNVVVTGKKSSPSAITLNNGVVKKSPLDFVPREEINTPPAEAGSLIIPVPE